MKASYLRMRLVRGLWNLRGDVCCDMVEEAEESVTVMKLVSSVCFMEGELGAASWMGMVFMLTPSVSLADVDAALYSTTPAILCSSASSITSISNQSYFVGNTYDSQEEDDDDDDERGNTTAYLGYLDSLGLFTWHPNVPHTACDIFLLDE